MRLLRTDLDHEGCTALVMEEFPGQAIPDYAILSHTWAEDEVLYSHILDGSASTRQGYFKIRCAADQARAHGWRYIWIDTCCINKDSSAELSEAINSMYAWYRGAKICYAYLVDVPGDVILDTAVLPFMQSRWFTRGWCLQELLAPDNLIFFSHTWTQIGTKVELHNLISTITSIDPDILSGQLPLETASIAKRMSWAATRQTTRVEDIAYCLMGIFSVNMPMLYGEGSRAFQRLQVEIMKDSDDHSLFAWVDPHIAADDSHGLLADSPACFANAGDIVSYDDWEDKPPFDMSNKGLHMQLHLTRCDDNIYAAALNCPQPYGNFDGFLAVYLKKLVEGSHQYARVKCEKLGALSTPGILQPVYVRQQNNTLDAHAVYPRHYLRLRRNDAAIREYNLIDLKHCKPMDSDWRQFSLRATSHCRRWVPARFPPMFKILKSAGALTIAMLFGNAREINPLIVMLGSITRFDVGFDAVEVPQGTDKLMSITELESLHFNPRVSGTIIDLENYRVRVDFFAHVEERSKIYNVDIELESVMHTKPLKYVLETVTKSLGLPETPPPPNGNQRKEIKEKKNVPWHKRLLVNKGKVDQSSATGSNAPENRPVKMVK